MKDPDCATIGYDITSRYIYEEAINYWYHTVKDYKTSILKYLIGNKTDMFLNEKVSSEEATDFAKKDNLRFFAISGDGIKSFG